MPLLCWTWILSSFSRPFCCIFSDGFHGSLLDERYNSGDFSFPVAPSAWPHAAMCVRKAFFIRDWRFSSSFQRIFCCCNRGGPRLHFPCKAALFNDCSFLSDGTEKTSTFPSHPLKVENWLIIWHLLQKSCEVSFRKCCQCYSTWRAQARRETNVFCSVTDYYEFLDHQFTLSWCYLLPVARS